MQIDLDRSRQYLKQFQFQPLFVEELGWDNYPSQPLSLLIENKSYTLKPIAEKRGQVVYTCLAKDGEIPNSTIRTKIHKEVSRYSLENVLIYIDQGETEQVWQWVRRNPGKPKANRFHQFHKSQSGDALLQKLEALAVSFDEEEGLTLVDVTSRTRRAFDVDRITKKFYERFKKEHGLFLKFIAGICSQFDQEWYCSLMLNRLMFVYFIQKKGFLDGNTDYLRDRLQACQSLQGQDSFHSFYRYFLLKLFHSGLGDPKRTPELEQLLGKVPYLNGGLFEVHQLEETYPDIQIPDQAFEKVFDFFDEYQWHLDDRPLHNDREINPDVLGYIFEKYINQKQMGAYYTKEDITEYISKNTIIPFLFNAAEKGCSIAFQPNGSMWRLLRENPDRYIYAAMQKGVDLPLPDEIAVGMADISQRQGWNRPANSEYALPTETWREHITRRQRCLELQQKLASGEVHSIDELIALNLDIRQFAQDVVENCEGSDLLRAFYTAICQVSILDPTCGSGAFLFAALNILEPLYDACLERMQVFLDDLKRSNQHHHPEALSDFHQVLERVAQHPNRRYFILKSIILNNLYGVDIMEEATEICKLRLFLKLVSQVERDSYAPNYGLEPLPDIDFNIRAGNTLVGFANYEEVRKAVDGEQQKKLDLFSDMERIDRSASDANQAFQSFRSIQTQLTIDSVRFREAKIQLREQLQGLNQELNRYLAEAYVVGLSKKPKEYDKWLLSHQPFHWFVEFYGIIENGGFDVIIGNPPYVEAEDVKEYRVINFETIECGDLYAYVLERTYKVGKLDGYVGMIVPISIFGVNEFRSIQILTLNTMKSLWVSCYSNRPSQLFDGAQKRLSILIGCLSKNTNCEIYTTKYFRWRKEEWDTLFKGRISYVEPNTGYFQVFPASLEKLGTLQEVDILGKLLNNQGKLADAIVSHSNNLVYYTRKFGYFLSFLNFIPEVREIKTGLRRAPSELKTLGFQDSNTVESVVAILSSSTFFWFWNILSDCRNLNRRDLLAFPLNPEILPKRTNEQFASLGNQLIEELRSTSKFMTKSGLYIETFEYASCKVILDRIDLLISEYYGFTEDEYDFIINHDIKYRMGADTEEK